MCEKMIEKFWKSFPPEKVIFPLLFYQFKSCKTVHSPLLQPHKQQSTGSKKLWWIGKWFATGNSSANSPNNALSSTNPSPNSSGHISAPMLTIKWEHWQEEERERETKSAKDGEERNATKKEDETYTKLGQGGVVPPPVLHWSLSPHWNSQRQQHHPTPHCHFPQQKRSHKETLQLKTDNKLVEDTACLLCWLELSLHEAHEQCKALVVHVVDMLAKCWWNIQMSKVLKKLCCFATFCPKQTQNLPVEPVSGGEPRTDPPSWR